MNDAIIIIINLYIIFSFIRAGSIFYEKAITDNNICKSFFDSIYYGFFGWFIDIYYKFNKRCGNCNEFNNNRCKLTGKFTGEFGKICKSFKRK